MDDFYSKLLGFVGVIGLHRWQMAGMLIPSHIPVPFLKRVSHVEKVGVSLTVWGLFVVEGCIAIFSVVN